MPRTSILPALALGLLALGSAVDASAQISISPRAASVTVGGRLHAQYQTSSIGEAASDFFVRRARLTFDLAFNEFLSGRIQPELSGGGASMLDAYAKLRFSEGFEVSMGQFKRAFDVFELVSSTDLSLIERDGRIAGYSECTGVGSVCSYSRLLEELDFVGRDAGARIEGTSGALSYMATLTNGRGVNTRDNDNAKSVSGRLSFEASDGIVLAGHLGVRDYLSPTAEGESENAFAWGADVQVGDWRDGFLLQAGLAGGDNWRSLDPADFEAGRFTAFQAVASYYHPVDDGRFIAVEPLARISVADPDGDVADDGGTLVTPGVMLYLMGKSKIGVNLDYYIPQTGDSEYSFKLQTFLYF